MKINYTNEPSDDSFDDHMEKESYGQSSKDIQHRWAKIRACKLELLKIYSEITCIEPPKNDYGSDTKEEWGICMNSYILFPVPASLFACSTGMVRKMRNKVPDKCNDGTCKSCPYFIPRYTIESRTNEEIAKYFNDRDKMENNNLTCLKCAGATFEIKASEHGNMMIKCNACGSEISPLNIDMSIKEFVGFWIVGILQNSKETEVP